MNQMMNSKILFVKFYFAFTIFLVSCSSVKEKVEIATTESRIKNAASTYEYKDINGIYQLKREIKLIKNKFYLRSTLLTADSSQLIEKGVTVADLGILTIENQKLPALRPFASEFEVWLDGERFLSQSKIDKKTKKIIYQFEPDFNKKNQQSFTFPSGSVFCYFSQIPECVRRVDFIRQAIGNKTGTMSLYIVWDSFPYNNEIFGGNLDSPFEIAKFSFVEEVEGEYKFALETSRYAMFYHFNRNLEFSKFFWIAHGISIKKI
jgi:hypothetical protein